MGQNLVQVCLTADSPAEGLGTENQPRFRWLCLPWGRGPGLPSVHRDNSVTSTLGKYCLYSWRRKWKPTPIPLPGKFHRLRSLAGYSPWGQKESDTTEQFNFLFSNYPILKCVVLVAQSGLALFDPMDYSPQPPLSMGFPKQEYWSGPPFPSPICT